MKVVGMFYVFPKSTIKPQGDRSTFAMILKKYHRETNPVTKHVLRDILKKRLMESVDQIDSGSFGKYTKMLKDI